MVRGQEILKWGFRGLGLLEMVRFKSFETEEQKLITSHFPPK